MGQGKAEKSQIIDNLRRVFHALHEYSRAAEQTTGLTGPQLWAIKLLASSAPMRVSDLAARMYLRSATVVGIIDRLEVKGLVSRSRSQQDRRAVILHLTEAGRELAGNAPEVAQLMLLEGLDRLTDEQFAAVEIGMQLMVRMLGAEHIKPQPMNG